MWWSLIQYWNIILFCILLSTLIDNFMWVMQAKILAQYQPRINTTIMLTELNQTEETTTKAIEYFKSTRHIVLYYEDLINNRTVRTKEHLLFQFYNLSYCIMLVLILFCVHSMNRNWRMFKNSYECHTEICTAVRLRYTQPHFLSKSKTGTKSRKHSKGKLF